MKEGPNSKLQKASSTVLLTSGRGTSCRFRIACSISSTVPPNWYGGPAMDMRPIMVSCNANVLEIGILVLSGSLDNRMMMEKVGIMLL